MTVSFPCETARLVLRPFEDRDIEPFQQYRSDPEVARYQGWEAPFPLEQAVQFVNEMKARIPGKPGEWYQIAIALKTTGALIGDCAFHRLDGDPAQAEIGFTLACPYQGRGYAAEAVTCLLDTLFGDLGLHRVLANCDPENTASSRLLQRVGMRHEGRFLESLWYKGRYVGEDWYALLRREWEERRNSRQGLPPEADPTG